MCYKGLLADAEFGEDGLEDVVGGDLAGDLAEVVDYAADVLGDEVAREVHAKGALGIAKCLVCQA